MIRFQQALPHKELENWILVELVDELLATGFAREVRTNVHFSADARRLTGRKLVGRKDSATHLSADILVCHASGACLSAEIKTGQPVNCSTTSKSSSIITAPPLRITLNSGGTCFCQKRMRRAAPPRIRSKFVSECD